VVSTRSAPSVGSYGTFSFVTSITSAGSSVPGWRLGGGRRHGCVSGASHSD
jgi:hypothetical protein